MELNCIKEVLKKKGVSQYRLAKDLNVSYASINKICQNKAQPRLMRLYEIALTLDVDPCELIVKENPLKKKVARKVLVFAGVN